MPNDPRDYKVEITGLTGNAKATDAKPQAVNAKPQAADAAPARRPFISVQFNCCKVYQRVYRSDDGERYEGRCPKCGRTVRFRVGAGGTDARAFVVE